MTPRQVIQQISERRHLQNITAKKVYFADEKYHNVCEDTPWLVNKTEYEANKKIKQSKLEEFLAQSVEDPRSVPWVETTYTTLSMYTTPGNYLQGNAVLTKSRESPTRFYDCNKERQRKTSDVSFTTLYTTFKNASDGNPRARTRCQKMDVVSKPKAKRAGRVDSWSESEYSHSGMSNIRGMAKKIHDKSTAMESIFTANEKDRLKPERKTVDYKVVGTAKHFEEQGQKVKNSGTRSRGMDGNDSTKQIRLHIYVPTAEMNS